VIRGVALLAHEQTPVDEPEKQAAAFIQGTPQEEVLPAAQRVGGGGVRADVYVAPGSVEGVLGVDDFNACDVALATAAQSG
jgi:hypothetical protein